MGALLHRIFAAARGLEERGRITVTKVKIASKKGRSHQPYGCRLAGTGIAMLRRRVLGYRALTRSGAGHDLAPMGDTSLSRGSLVAVDGAEPSSRDHPASPACDPERRQREARPMLRPQARLSPSGQPSSNFAYAGRTA